VTIVVLVAIGELGSFLAREVTAANAPTPLDDGNPTLLTTNGASEAT